MVIPFHKIADVQRTDYERRIMKKLNKAGYILALIFALSLFLSVKLQNVLGSLLFLLFGIAMASRGNRENFLRKLDRRIGTGLLIFVITPYVIAFLDGGLKARIDMDDYMKFLLFFPLVFFLGTEKRMWNFLKSLLAGSVISLLITLGIFIRKYDIWANTQGLAFERVYFELSTQDFANIMSIVLLFLVSFIFFYKPDDRKKNMRIKIFLTGVAALNIFILIVNRSKMVYVCLIPTILYILWKKNRKYILVFCAVCCAGYFVLPESVSERLRYIVYVRKDPSSNLRLIFWDGAVAAVQKSPLIGMQSKERWDFNREYYKQKGVYDYVMTYYPEFEKENMRNGLDTHNMYLQFLVYFGIGTLALAAFFFLIVPSRLMKIQFYRTSEESEKGLEHRNSENEGKSGYTAFEIALKSSYICYLIQGLTEINLNNKSMIIAFSMLLCMINFAYRRYAEIKK